MVESTLTDLAPGAMALTPDALMPHQRVFLAGVARHGVVSTAAREAGVSIPTAYRWLARPAFAALRDAALRECEESAKAELLRRGRDGVTRPVFQGGKRATDADGAPACVQEYDTPALIAWLRAHCQEFRPQVDVRLTGMLAKAYIDVDATAFLADHGSTNND